ncbi:uncharacterized protein LOC132624190 [Lycium barbarum]|uniref:uncharacterized protein LOC132624190 n=1 Tax=Lycium barbarum TaxID=112863 RepID=UPI00293E3F3B|nr:uncharacterized protein LOC132624190 [Lycium barbarum]
MGTKRNVQADCSNMGTKRNVLADCSNRKKQLPQLGSQVQQVPLDSISSAIQEQVQQMSQDSTTQEENEQSEEGAPSTEKRKRARTQMLSVHGRTECKLIVLNKYNQPVGPTPAVVAVLGSFLGTLARKSTFCPVNVLDWRKLKTHKDMWSYTKEKYDIPGTTTKWDFKAISNVWRRYETWSKQRYYLPYATDELRMAKRPANIPQSHFKYLIEYWNSYKAKEKEKESSDAVTNKDIFVTTRKRKPGRAEMDRIETQESEDGSQSVDAFASVMGSEHPGCVRLYGRGVTKTVLKEKVGNSGPSLNITDEMMQQKMEAVSSVEKSIDSFPSICYTQQQLGSYDTLQLEGFYPLHSALPS